MKFKFILIFFFFCSLAYAQNVITPLTEWTITNIDKNDLTTYQREVSIVNSTNSRNDVYIQYRFFNQSSNDLFVSWNFIKSYINFEGNETPNEENYRALHLKAKEDFIPNYKLSNQNLFFVFKEFKNNRSKAKLVVCELANFKIKLL